MNYKKPLPGEVQGIFIDVNSGTSKLVAVNNELGELKKLISCNLIDIPRIKIGDIYFRVVCDDIGAITAYPQVSALDVCNRPLLFGNLFIVQFDGKEDITSLTAAEIDYINNYIKELHVYEFKGRFYCNPVVRGCGY